ncbi:MAG: Uma2 family endonuclease [Brasilonema sp.]
MATLKSFTIEEYHRLADLGFFTEDDRLELINGEIVQMSPKGTRHTTCCSNLLEELAVLVVGRAKVRCQDPISLPSKSEPEPDFTIVKKQAGNYLSSHPKPSDILLIIEIADSSLQYDQEEKLPLYAAAGISDYWIFNLVDNHLEAYSEPLQEVQGKFAYRLKRIILANETVTLPYLPDLSLDLSQIFPGLTGE